MITLIGHGYIGEHIAQEINNRRLPFFWINHNETIAQETTVIINAAGYTGSPNVDACEIYKQETINGNVVWPLMLEQQFPKIPIVHISSGCVYTDYKDGGWTELDPPNFDFNNGSFYSGAKSLEQKLLEPYMDKSYLLRIRMPFGDYEHPKNLLTKLVKYNKLINFENSLSYVNDVARIAVNFALDRPETGVYNVCNPGSKTTKEIADLLGLTKEWFDEDEFKANTRTPRSNCVLNNDKLSRVYPIQNVDSALAEAIRKLNG
jgi:UDP-glucose 4,6-dehydratase